MKIRIVLLIFLILSQFLTGQHMQLPIIPKPQKVALLSEQCDVKSIKYIHFSDESLSFTASLVKGAFEQKDISLSESDEATNNSSITLSIIPESSLITSGFQEGNTDEAYMLTIKENSIHLEAATPKGMFYAAMSLIQLIENGENIPQCEITDYPVLPIRGISDDISRGQVSTLENFKHIIRTIARYKMNTYMPYLEDMVVLESFPDIGKERGALTKEEIKEIVSFAEMHYVEVIPIFQTLGHYENILSMDKYVHLAEFPGSASLCVSCPETYEFLEKALEEVFELFPSKYFHMGADESFDVGKGKSYDLVKESDIATVHAEHYKKVYEICKKHGKEVLMYGDVILHHPEILKMIPDDITIVDWHYGAKHDYPSTDTFADHGFPYYVSPSVWNFTSTFPVNLLAITNIKYFIEDGLKNGTDGMINSNWGDFGAETIKELILYGYAWSAECAWNSKGNDIYSFSKYFFTDYFQADYSTPFYLYQTLGNTLNQIYWHALWRHPLLPMREAKWWQHPLPNVVNLEWLRLTIPELRKEIENLRNDAGANNDHAEILDVVTDFSEFYAMKLETQYMLEDRKNGKAVDDDMLLEKIDENIDYLKTLKTDFRKVWLAYYKEANLYMIDDKFDRMITYFSEISESIKDGKELLSPEIEGSFIFAFDADSAGVKKATFEKSFELSSLPESAKLHFIADSKAELFINGEFVDSLFVKRSLSLWPEYKRTLMIDILPYLKEGVNTICVDSESFYRFPEEKNDYQIGSPAGVHILAKLYYPNETKTLVTDKTWKVRFGNQETNATEKPYHFTIIGPNFETGRKAWIER